jgi:hypothetical protein
MFKTDEFPVTVKWTLKERRKNSNQSPHPEYIDRSHGTKSGS